MSSVTVSTAAQFEAAVAAAASAGKAGETILLQPGVYQNLVVGNFSGVGPLVIESASTSSPAVVEGMSVQYSSDITLSGLTFSNANDAASQINDLFELTAYYDSNVVVQGSTFSGSATNTIAADAGKGVYVHNDTGITLTNDTYNYLLDGIANVGSNGVTKSNSLFSNIFDDGINSSSTSNVNISGNNFSTFHTDPTDATHPDAIQFWTTGVTANSSNIAVENNTITRGAGAAVQGIFITSQNNYGYSNVTVTGNVVTGESDNGIWVDSSSNINVSGNTIQPYADSISRLILTSDVGGQASNNKVGSNLVTSGLSGVTVSNDPLLAAVPVPSVASFVSSAAGMSSDGSVASTGVSAVPTPIAPVILTPSSSHIAAGHTGALL